MKKYEAGVGQHFASFAKELKEISEKKNEAVVGVFNDVEIEVTKEKTIEEITSEYHEGMAENTKKWEQSEKGKEYKKKLEERKKKAQKELDQLMEEFKTVNRHDYKELLKWIAKVQDYTDNSTLERPIKEIVDALKEANYKANENIGENFIKGDRENEARYIIGQALSGLEGVVGAMHPMVATFAEKWLKTYGEKEVVKVQAVQNVGIYINGELELYARGTASDNYSRLVDFQEWVRWDK